ncbi:MAG: MBOAT family protein [Dehalococcoidia bacterium]|nr:MBOAT family protein [Dehalococcoidia bacterium]
MLFPTVDFAIFFVVVFTIAWALRPWHLAWRGFLVAASFFFYGFWDERFVLLLGASTLFNWVMGAIIATAPREIGGMSRERRVLIAVGVVANLAVLGWFKYYGFFASSLRNLLGDIGIDAGLPLLEITLPVAISFFTFHAISYLVDVGRDEVKPMSLLNFALYLSFFPHLVAGPIVRVTEFAPQLAQPLRQRLVEAEPAFKLILLGLFKKVVISSYVASEIADPVFALPGERSSQEIILGVYAYAVQIYADFSGYTDMAIGCALLLGISFPQNFDAPYRALSLQDFWRRWHMTLSRWLRDYLYIGLLGGNRGTPARTSRNLFLTMLLGGLWHGAAWTFVIWGAIHGAGLIVERRVKQAFAPYGNLGWLGPVLAWFVTFHVVCLAWIFFRAESVGVAFEILVRMFTAWGPSPLVSTWLMIVIGAAIAAQFLPSKIPDRLQWGFGQLAPAAQAFCLAGALVLVDAMGPQGVAPFIYFQF